eukprot:jgi/Undpi1/3591/HiC_scaffold_16.g06963.m1
MEASNAPVPVVHCEMRVGLPIPTWIVLHQVQLAGVFGRCKDALRLGQQVNKRQENNPLLRHVRNVPYEITPGILADFVLGPKACALFISLRYHLLYPNYLIQRVKEAARYLETYKAYEHKSAESIQEKVNDDYLSKLQECFGAVRSVNKSDVLTLASNFGTLKAVCDASAEELALCPGLGDKKVARIYEALHAPLSRTKRAKGSQPET